MTERRIKDQSNLHKGIMDIESHQGRIAEDTLYAENTWTNVGQHSLSSSPWRIATEREIEKTSAMNENQTRMKLKRSHVNCNFHVLASIKFDYTTRESFLCDI